MNFLNLAETNAPLLAEIEEAASKVIRSGCYLHGPETKAFEAELAAHCGARFAIGVSNGLDALRLIIRGYMELGRLRKGDGVMVAANTYIATVIPITEFGLVPV
ncbi:MAG: DegT/DnrJ/EryC1/StrS family aminotransferase, partial [Muribaculaceae bacterium]|nr:DegT/DnrJ/EryC1/StrS family aminotransferase [Muribaculaceae bacterium]